MTNFFSRAFSTPARVSLAIAASALCCTLAQAATIQDAVNDMLVDGTQAAPVGDGGNPSSRYTCPKWCWRPNVTQWAPYAYYDENTDPYADNPGLNHPTYRQRGHLAPYLPSWMIANRDLYTPSVTPWFVVMEEDGNAATNTAVEIRDVRVYMMRNDASKSWVKVVREPTPTWASIYTNPSSLSNAFNATPLITSNSMVVHLPKDSSAQNQFVHGGNGGTPLPVDASSDVNPQGGLVRAMIVAIDYRLTLKNTNGPDDRASARYVIDVGADYYPLQGQGSWGTDVIPGMGNGRMHRIGTEWKTATLLVPNFTAYSIAPSTSWWEYYPEAWTRTTALKDELFANPPTEALGTGTPADPGLTVPAGPTHVGAFPAYQVNRCLDVIGSSSDDHAGVNIYDCTASYLNQQWTFKNVGNGQYQLIARHSGKCLDVPQRSQASGSALQQFTCNNDPATNQNQLWTLKRVAGTTNFQIASVNTPTLCVDVRANTTANGTLVQQYTCSSTPNNSQNQLWYFQP